ncbi:UvrB/UvrC motif-containing protein [Chlamydia gallinacea]|uniref:UvrB/UvrC motif-containing protein n=2 Tax=Chlamydia gallinacea TaxID=1457153 RepID=A0ABS7ITS4_9CHLA|nr:UvrB/UvrC motif-containing protein [Chlamydia gallinacea]MBX6679975.1 UvrB/UvrC motif-containing protein [Chlamydia gallinacea]
MMFQKSSHLCYLCHKPASICYTEVDQNRVIRSYVCDSCPCPSDYYSRVAVPLSSLESSLTLECGNCKTIWQPYTNEDRLFGCHLCYTNFKTPLIAELIQNKALFSSLTENSQSSLHIGRGPGETASINPLLKLIALNEALQDTLSREDYEQAALIRDQINHLKNQNSHDSTQ